MASYKPIVSFLLHFWNFVLYFNFTIQVPVLMRIAIKDTTELWRNEVLESLKRIIEYFADIQMRVKIHF